MKGRILNLTYDVEVSAGEAFTLPDDAAHVKQVWASHVQLQF